MFYGYSGSARHSFSWSLIHVALLKNLIFTIPITDVVMSHMSEDTGHGESDYVIGFRERCSLKRAFVVAIQEVIETVGDDYLRILYTAQSGYLMQGKFDVYWQ
jgi:hypothetical protein